MPIPLPAPPVTRYDLKVSTDGLGRAWPVTQNDAAGEWTKWSEVDALLRQRAQAIDEPTEALREEIAELKAVCEDSNAVCVCGCPVSEHDSYGDEGEACEHDDHECVRTSKAVYAIVHRLRAHLTAQAQAIEELTVSGEDLQAAYLALQTVAAARAQATAQLQAALQRIATDGVHGAAWCGVVAAAALDTADAARARAPQPEQE